MALLVKAEADQYNLDTDIKKWSSVIVLLLPGGHIDWLSFKCDPLPLDDTNIVF